MRWYSDDDYEYNICGVVSAVSTSPPGGNQVDGSPPAASLNHPKVLDHGRPNFEKHEICWKLTSPGSKWRLKIQNRFADAKLALRGTIEVTRRDGLSSLKSNTRSAVGMLSGSWGGTYVWQVGWKMWILEQLHHFKIVGYIFLTPTRVIAWHMQSLSSIHRLSEKFERVQGFWPWGGKIENY